MTPQEFRDKFPDCEERNTNCLKDIACPECGNRSYFRIVGTSLFRVVDEGTEDNSDIEWDENSPACCGACGHDAKLGDFTVTGLDKFL